jgi:hypothetical protein
MNSALAALQDDCRRLSYYSVTSRCPADLYESGEEEAREMIAAARRVRAQILSCLP